MPNLIALAIPLFFVAIGVELVVARRRQLKIYRLNDSISDLSAGILNQVTGLWATAVQVIIYVALYKYRLIDWSAHSPWPWVVAFVGVDFLYYWWHRLSHEVNILWAAHVVHHQSEEYNLSVALRQSVLTSWTSLPFYLPLALLGVPALAFGVSLSLSTLYQFWIHTRLVGKLGAVEFVINTPSHHRVHHAINPQYLDKNYGATLIVWDRLFGTLTLEEAPCVYGIVKPLNTFEPLWAQFHYFKDILKMSVAAPHLMDKLRAFVARPDWRPRDTPQLPPAPDVNPETFVKFDRLLARPRFRYLLVQIGAVVVATFSIVMWGKDWPTPQRLALTVAITISVFGMGVVIQNWQRFRAIEVTRFLALIVCALFLAPPLVQAVTFVWCAYSLMALWSLAGDAPSPA